MEAFWKNETGIHGLYEVLDYYHSMFPPAAMHAMFTTNHDENSHSGSEYARMGNAANIFAILCCTWNGIPLIYSGQEMPNTKSLKFFDKDPIEWTGRYELHDFFKKLLSLRKTNKAMQVTADKVQRLYTNDERCLFSYLRKNDSEEVLVIMNLSHEEKHKAQIQYSSNHHYKNIFTGETMEVAGQSSFKLQPWTALVLEKTSL
jgi:glycosidase